MFQRLYNFSRHHWLTLAFILGFVVDNLTLTRVDQVFDNVILLLYIALAMFSILGLYAGISERFSERVNIFLKEKSPIVMQYAFGGLLSGMLIFYGRSSSIQDSWPFLLMILAVIFGNETIKDRAGRMVYNLVIFFVGLFVYLTLIIPVITGKMSAWVFVGSGTLAFVIMLLFLGILQRIIPKFMRLQKRNTVFIIGIIYCVFNVLYFTNIIPPIPLSLKHIGMYHTAERTEDGRYVMQYESPEWWEWYRKSDTKFHTNGSDTIYCYAAIFAPSRLTTKVFHHWEFYKPKTGEWEDRGKIPYEIRGGRDGGYRGFTYNKSYEPGEWRCTVETERGQIIGRETFEVVKGTPRIFKQYIE